MKKSNISITLLQTEMERKMTLETKPKEGLDGLVVFFLFVLYNPGHSGDHAIETPVWATSRLQGGCNGRRVDGFV
jgi:hypothetical protein